MLHPLQSQLVEGTAWLDPFVHDFRTRFLSLLAGAFRDFAPALALSILDPQLTFSEAQTQSGVSAAQIIRKADGSALSAYDLKRLQVGPFSPCVSLTAMSHLTGLFPPLLLAMVLLIMEIPYKHYLQVQLLS